MAFWFNCLPTRTQTNFPNFHGPIWDLRPGHCGSCRNGSAGLPKIGFHQYGKLPEVRKIGKLQNFPNFIWVSRILIRIRANQALQEGARKHFRKRRTDKQQHAIFSWSFVLFYLFLIPFLLPFFYMQWWRSLNLIATLTLFQFHSISKTMIVEFLCPLCAFLSCLSQCIHFFPPFLLLISLQLHFLVKRTTSYPFQWVLRLTNEFGRTVQAGVSTTWLGNFWRTNL